MAKKSNKYDNIELTSDELREIDERLTAAGKNTYENWARAVREATEAKRQAAMEKDLRDQWDNGLRTMLGDLVQNSNTIGDFGSVTPSNEIYAKNLYNYVMQMLEAGLDPYSDPEIQNAVAEATNRKWALPYNAGVDWDEFTRRKQDEAYAQAIRDLYGDSPFNFGVDEEYIRANGLEGILDAETLARNSLAPLLREETEEERRQRENLEWMSQIPATDVLRGAVTREEKQRRDRLRAERQAEELARPTVSESMPRNGTPAWMSDEYEDINTRAENPFGGVQYTDAGQAYRDQLAGALNSANAPASGAAYQDYLAGLSAQGGASAGTGSMPSAGRGIPGSHGGGYTYGGTGSPRRLTDAEQQDAYRSMLDALARGSNGGMATTNGFVAANRINDSLAEITDPKPVYQKYANYGGNTLTRDKDYNYLNRLLKINK